jgi:hypothetical protein
MSKTLNFNHSHAFKDITGKPTTIEGYGITDAKISGGKITLGENSITPLTSIPSTYATQTYVTNEIGKLDVASVGGSGKYIQSISEVDGKISAVAAQMPSIPTVPSYTLDITKSGSTATATTIKLLKDGTAVSAKNLDTSYSHSHDFKDITNKPTTIGGYNITDAYTKTECDNRYEPKITQVDHGTSSTTFALTPNVFHVWGTVSSLTLTLSAGTSGMMNEYMFQFTSPSNIPTVLSLPSTVKWVNDTQPDIEANKTYQASILNNIIVIGSVSV